jgi:spermidine/putrescine transport system substrate-binding protein/spermidine/putrescine transport system permease protein
VSATTQRGETWPLLLFSLAVFGFLYVPLLVLIVFSFNESRLMMDWQGFTTMWYRILSQDSRMLDSLANSLWVALWTTLLSLGIGVPAGVALAQGLPRANRAFELLVLLPLIVPEIILAVAFAGVYGVAEIRLSFLTIIITHVAFSLSYVILLVRSRMARLDPALVEAALDLNAPERVVFTRVILPHLVPALVSAALIVFTISLDDYVITSFVAGVGSTTLPLQIYSMAKEGLTPEINAICTILLVATLLMVLLAHWVQNTALSWRKATPAVVLLAVLLGGPLAWSHWGQASQSPQELNLFIWSSYLSPDTLKVFEQRFQARVQCDLYDSNEALLAKLQAGNAGYDIVVPGDYTVQILRRRGLLSPIDKGKIPNLGKNLDPQFLNRAFDPGNRYSVPYIFGTTGIGYRKEFVPQPVESWRILWNDRYRNRIVMLDDMRENFGAALKLMGHSINSQNTDEVQRARQLLERQKPLLRAYNSSNFQELLVSGDAWLVQGWNGQIVRAALENPNIGYFIPREGTMLFVDSFCIPLNAAHKALAHQFINYMLEPETAAAVMNHTGYTVANRAARPLVKRALLNHPALFPDSATVAKCEMLEDIGDTILLYDRLWTEVKSR